MLFGMLLHRCNSSQVPTNLNTSAIGESFVSVNWSPSSDSDVLGYKVYVNGNFIKF